MSTTFVRALAGPIGVLALSLGCSVALAQEARVYTEGNVIDMTSVRTKPAMFDEYMKFLAGPWRQEQEELKKQGVVLDYGIYNAMPRTPSDADLYLVVVYKNMATLDTLMEKEDAVEKVIYGSMDAGMKAAVSRESVRTILGSQIVRKLNLTAPAAPKPAG